MKILNYKTSIPIINVLLKNNYPIIGSFPRLSTKGLWRGGSNFNVSIYLETNTFFDFVTNTAGNPIDLHCLITGESKFDLNLNDFNQLYLDPSEVNYNYTETIPVDFSEIKKEIENIYRISSDILNDHYFNNKNINHKYLKNIKQLSFSNFMKKIISRKKLNLSKSDENLISLNNSLIIPMYNISDFSLQSIQYILDNKDLNKIFHYGGKLKNSFFPINYDINLLTQANTICLCEGVATGCSIYQILEKIGLNIPVLCCFNAMNIKSVAQYLIKNSSVNIIICADYDQINILNNKVLIGAGNNSFKLFNNEPRVLVTNSNNGKFKSQYFLESLFDESPIKDKIKKNEFTDFNDLHSLMGVDVASSVFKENLFYYTKYLNKENFIYELKNEFENYNLDINKNPYSGNSFISDKKHRKLDLLNGIILESQLFFYS